MTARDHQQEMVALYRAGETLEQVGTRFGVTRERARQLIKQAGFTGRDGGQRVRAAETSRRREIRLAAKRDKRCLRLYGCSYAEALLLNDYQRPTAARSNASRYRDQMRNAAVRGIEWEITFPEWMSVWRDSGHFSERGRGVGRYVMGRTGDVGPYAIGNVYITECGDNIRDYHAARKARGVSYLAGSSSRLGSGRGWTFYDGKYQVVAGKRYVGRFATKKEAELAYQRACAELRAAIAA